MSEQSISEQSARFAIDVAIEYGRRGINKPPSDDHWLMPYWQIGRDLSSSQQVREEALMDLQYVAGFKAGWNAQLDGDEEAMARMLERTTEALRALKSTPASPSQPSSVAMTDEIVAYEMVHNTGADRGLSWKKDNPLFGQNWIANPLVRPSPKGASTGTEREVISAAIKKVTGWPDVKAGELSLLEEMSRSLSSPQEASKPQDEQPSAASGRELPPLPKPAYAFGTKGMLGESCYTADQMRERDAMWMERITALTGAAPADANVGGHIEEWEMALIGKSVQASMNGEVWKTGTLVEVTDLFAPYRVRLDDSGEFRTFTSVRATPTAPEPSAPADKVDAERYYTMRDWFLREGLRSEIDPYGHINHTTPAIVDAAIDRMRSEDGKGGKL